jgi:CRP/FNR family transcriptional regulator, cyclic AMP receptor protein
MSDEVQKPRLRFKAAAEGATPVDADDLALLAGSYAEHAMFDEAIHLYEMACKLRPGSVALKINLARVHDRKSRAESERYAELRNVLASERVREETDASQYAGLAEHYIARDQTAKAIELLEIAKIRTPGSSRPREVLARLYYSSGQWEAAHEESATARALNPFDRSLAELSGRIEFELKNYEGSLDEFVDAFLLCVDQKGEESEPVRRMVNTLRRIIGLDAAALNGRIRQRVAHLQRCAERLEFRKESLFRFESGRELGRIVAKVRRDAEKRENLIQVSSELRTLTVLQHLRDEQIFRLSRFARTTPLAAGEFLFHENDRSMDFHVIRDGTLEVRKETPFGPQVLASLGPGQIVGEMNFIDRAERSTDAVATVASDCFTFSFSALDRMMDDDREMAVALHWAFWRSLSEKVRDANEQLKSFFVEEARTGGGKRRVEGKREVQTVSVRSEEKVDLFRERGLSAAEMKLLATFSSEERFRTGSMIFREGEGGDKLYIVLDGRVRISKFIPGVGEEALAVLDRGDFFGEMALIDDNVRSADAKAHDGDATVLSIDRATLNEILAMDPHASLQFLNLLCRMISRRLREINDKIVQWKYMSGGF